MVDTAPPTSVALFRSLNTVKKEMQETYNMLEGNLFATLTYPMLGFVFPSVAVLARISGPPGAGRVAAVLLNSLVWFLGYAYVIDIENQRHGAEEDKLNDIGRKRNRPLVKGDWTMAGACRRTWVARGAYTAMSALIGGLPLTLCALSWIITCKILYCFRPLNFIVKNYICMSSGTTSIVIAAWMLAGGPMDFATIEPLLLMPLWVGLGTNVQDLRDERGDRAAGRLTVPVLIGVRRARKVWAVECGVLVVLAACYLLRSSATVLDVALGVGAAGLVITSLKAKDRQDDDLLYRRFCYFTLCLSWRCFLCVAKGTAGL